MEPIVIPEVIILNSIKSLLKLIRDDYNNVSDKNLSLLNRALGSLNLEKYKLSDQAKSVFASRIDDPRLLDVNLFFNMSRVTIPTIHITLNNESPFSDGMNIDENFQEQTFGNSDDTYRKVYSRSFQTTYNLVITSDNTNEVILIYHFLRAILIPLFNHFEASGLQQCKLSGGDININSTLIPPNIYIRAINLSFNYDVNVADLFDMTKISRLIFSQDPAILPDSEVDQSS